MNPAQHRNDIRAVIKYFLKYWLFVKLEKFFFCIKEILFLKFLLITEKVKIEPGRVSTITEWPEPTTFKEIKVFLKFANFYRCFIMGFSRIVRELIDMFKNRTQEKLKGVLFTFTLEVRRSFLNLHTAFTTATILTYFDPLLPIYIELDSSSFAISAIFSQVKPNIRHWHFVVF